LVGVAVAEEVLFRGFIFQRLISDIGQWFAQLVIGVVFLLTQLGNLGITDWLTRGSFSLEASIPGMIQFDYR
jgi:membrane protease YdiL (CAAX protease family)